MPREASKLGHRGIGFVTFASPDAVEKLMASRHTLKGQELAVDRATPKEKVCRQSSHVLGLNCLGFIELC